MSAVTSGRNGAGRAIHRAWAPLLAVLLLAGSRAVAEPVAGGGLELDLRDVPLVTAINMLVAQTGAEISFVDPQAKLANRKVVFLAGHPKTVEDALQRICKATGCYFEKEPGGEFVVSPDPLASTAAAPAATSTAPSSASSMVDSLPQTEEIVRIPLNYMDARDMKNMLENSTPVLDNHVLSPGTRSFRGMKDLDIVPGTFDGTTGNYIPPPTFTPASMSSIGATGAGQFPGGFGTPGIGGGIGQPGFGAGGIGTPGAAGAGGVNGQGGGLVPPNILGIYAFPLDNSLIVRGDPDAIQDLKRVIQLLDVPAKQIQIKVEQIRIETSAQKSFGFDWDVVNNDIAVQTNLGNSSGGGISVAIAGANWHANLSALLTSGKATIVDSATVSTLNNVPALISSFSQSFYFIPVRQQIQGAGLVTTYTPTPLVIPTTLTATPRVNGDGTITMLIPFSISRPSGNSVGPDGTTLPNQIGTQLFILRRVPSGSTVVIGALSNKDDTESDNSVPLLSEIPIIGPLFRSRLNTKSDGETLFFFTPTLLPDLPGQTEAAP